MEHKFGHIIAFSTTVALHAGAAAWAMHTTQPQVMPQQQVVRVSMIAEVPPAPAAPKPAIQKAVEALPPKPQGIKKVAPKKEAKKLPAPKPETKAEPVQNTSLTAKTTATPTPQPPAITKPLFNAAYLQNPAPEYPAAARRRNIEGKVLLHVIVSPEGNPEQVMVNQSSGSALLDEAARKAVEHWRFIPAKQGSTAISASVIVPIIFKIGESS